jgi:GT2 family glycosyltransferase
MSDGARRVYGLAPADVALNVRWLDDPPADRRVPMLCGCFFAMPRAVFESVGGFDPSMRFYGAEDLELCLRLWRLGHSCVVAPEADVSHRFRERSASEVDWPGFLHNLLRLGTLHLCERNLARLVESMCRHPAFPAAATAVATGDATRRRAALAAEAAHDDQWFFDRFEIDAWRAER